MALAGPMSDLLGEQPLLIGISVFHLVVCAAVLFVPGVKEMKSGLPPYTPKVSDSSLGEQK
jgi:hypothetical protein